MRPSPFMGDRHDVVSVNAASPAAGSPFMWNAPANAVVQVVGLQIVLATSVGVFNRHVELYINDTGIQVPRTPAAIVQGGNKTWTYYFTMGIAPLDMTALNSNVYQPFGCCYQLDTGSFLIVNAHNLQATDQFSSTVIRYFLWDKG